jgi:hypothetical protein
MKKKLTSDDLDIFEILISIWINKVKIFSIMLITVILTLVFYSFYKKPHYKAITEIYPISVYEENSYIQFNNLIQLLSTEKYNFESAAINKETLTNLFLDEIRNKGILIEAIKKYQLIDKTKYKSEELYLDIVEKKASSLRLIAPSEKTGTVFKPYWTIELVVNDKSNKSKWEQAAKYINKTINKKIRRYLIENFNSIIENTKLLNQFDIDDIEYEINNIKQDFDIEMKKLEMTKEFKLEDLSTQIDNKIKDYDRITKDNLAFLKEQAAIARTLNIKKNTIESQIFDTQNNTITNFIETETPLNLIHELNQYYLRGYEAIEKNINLINDRTNKKPFIKDLLKLEQNKRTLEQNKTIQRSEKNKLFLDDLLNLNKKKQKLLNDNTLERISLLFSKTPVNASNNFKAANIIYNNISFKSSYSLKLKLLQAAIIGLIFGMFFVIINTAMVKRK